MKKLIASLLAVTMLAGVASADSLPGVVISTASSNLTKVQNGPTRLTVLMAINTTATLAYIHVFDLTTSGSPACTGTNEKHIIPVPASTTGAGFTLPESEAELYQNGLLICITGAGTAGDNSNAPAGVYMNYAAR